MPQLQKQALSIVKNSEPCVHRLPDREACVLTDNRAIGAHCTASICFSDNNKLSVDNDLCSILSAASPLFASQLKERNVIIPLSQ